ncbi:type II toxin-antitoxin system VapC family toxin [Phyllobacterium sp. SYP-B3895]|uniref:type II toxin-antitoxin system VapC family toxin n=1 Tax=Phyllobacterium sp. SYP-B3895 TaxID=2663240 RepID=UPI003519EA39
MYVDACALVAILADEAEAARISDALVGATKRFTSPVAVLEAVLALSRPDKFNLPVAEVESLVTEFLEVRGIELLDLPPTKQATRLALAAAHLYGRAGGG